MPSHMLPVSIERGPVADYGRTCPECDDYTNPIEAVVTVAVVEDGQPGTVETDREVCLSCVWHVIRDEHAADGVARVVLAPDAPTPFGVYDPFAPAS
jgi:hypothetical protein